MAGPVVGVTGATGRVGGGVAHRLAEAGVDQRMMVRDPDRAPQLPRAEVAVAGFGDAEAARAALEGVGTLFMVSAAETDDRVAQHRTFIDAAAAAGVERVVYLSLVGAGRDATFTLARDHWATEEHIRASGLIWTFMRDNLYLDVLPMIAGDAGVIRGPADGGRLAAVAIDDVADCVAAVLEQPDAHAHATYSLTGPEALTLAEIAATMTEVTGRAVRFENETVDEAYASRSEYGAPDWQVEAWVTTYTAIAAGEYAEVTGDVEQLASHLPRSLADVLKS